MKLIITFLIAFFTFTINVCADTNKLEVKLHKCVDGDTAWFIAENKKIKTRFLAIDTPEATNKIEPFGKEASNYTCNLLSNANKIEIEYDNNSDKYDKYDRHLVWVFVDDKLLQLELIKEGLGKVEYLYGDYKYTTLLQNAEDEAKYNNIGLWNNSRNNIEDDSFSFFIIFVILLLILLFLPKKILKRRKI